MAIHLGFLSPGYLLALLVIPLLVAFTSSSTDGDLANRGRIPIFGVLAHAIEAKPSRWQRYIPLAMLALALALTATALARPELRDPGTDRSATIVLVVDVSGSMDAADLYPNRPQAAVTGMRDFLQVCRRTTRSQTVAFTIGSRS